jgi:hypothetical protein
VDVKKWLRVAFGLLGYDTVQFHRWLWTNLLHIQNNSSNWLVYG